MNDDNEETLIQASLILFVIAAVLLLAVTVLDCKAETRRVNVKVIDFGTELPREYVEHEVKKGLKKLRRGYGKPFRLRKIVDAVDPTNLTWLDRADYFEALFRPRRKRNIVIGVYESRVKNAYGISRVCAFRSFIGLGIKRDVPYEWLSYAVAHEVGHTLGAYHREPLLFDEPDDPLIYIMYPYWDVYLDKWYEGKAVWGYAVKTKAEWGKCGKLSTITQWEICK